MKNSTKIKKILILFVVFGIVLTLVSNTYATTPSSNVEDWVLKMNAEGVEKPIITIAGFLIAIIRIATIIVAVIMMIIIGLRYMSGSIENKTADKKLIIKIVVGVIVMVSVSGVVEIIFKNIYTEG